MRATVTCLVKRDDRVVLRGEADLQSGPRGWRVTVYADREFDAESLPDGRYQLELPTGLHSVRFDSVRAVTHEVRFVGIGDAPSELKPRGIRYPTPRSSRNDRPA